MTPVHVEVERNTRSVAVARTGFQIPGLLVGVAASGMRYTNRLDLALIAAEVEDGVVAAGTFTTNHFRAAPVEICKAHLDGDNIRAILVNAGIANACTGEEGIRRAREILRLTAEALGGSPETILPASTGIIGMQLDVESVGRVLPELIKGLKPNRWEDAARAIMTTDTVPKMAWACTEIGGKKVTVGGIAKGSGMIAPNMATLLAFVGTDAAIEKNALNWWARSATDQSFNAISVDGDTSTNDTLLVLATGRAGNPMVTDPESYAGRRFGLTLTAVLLDLAKQIVMDGEGATKLIEIRVTGAPDLEAARRVALTVANSPLVKTAFFGEDANWGRIVAAAGRAGVALVPERVTLFFNGTCVFRRGTPVGGPDTETKATEAFRQKEILVELGLGLGEAEFTAYTCDLSYDYVKINASYRS